MDTLTDRFAESMKRRGLENLNAERERQIRTLGEGPGPSCPSVVLSPESKKPNGWFQTDFGTILAVAILAATDEDGSRDYAGAKVKHEMATLSTSSVTLSEFERLWSLAGGSRGSASSTSTANKNKLSQADRRRAKKQREDFEKMSESEKKATRAIGCAFLRSMQKDQAGLQAVPQTNDVFHLEAAPPRGPRALIAHIEQLCMRYIDREREMVKAMNAHFQQGDEDEEVGSATFSIRGGGENIHLSRTQLCMLPILLCVNILSHTTGAHSRTVTPGTYCTTRFAPQTRKRT